MNEDGETVHIVIRAYDPKPEEVRRILHYRDTLSRDDNVGVIIDTFNDERSALEFDVKPKGAKVDMVMSDTKSWYEDYSWNAIWESVSAIDDESWIAEMTIPFRALRFLDTDHSLEWNIEFRRTAK